MPVCHELSTCQYLGWLGENRDPGSAGQSRGVVSAHRHFCTLSELSCKSLEGQEGLRQLIFQVTCNMKDVGSTIGCQRLAGGW